jgi:tetratricopeptide (TPR) repeat protein
MDVGVPAAKRRLPFVFRAQGGTGRLLLSALPVGPYLDVERLELDVADVSVEDPDDAPAERFQRRRCQLSRLTVRLGQDALGNRVEATRRQLAALGISQVHARLGDGFVSVRARIADGLAVAEVSFRVFVAHFGTVLRVLAGAVRVHGQLPIPGPLIADRVMSALLMVGEGDAASDRRPITRGLCDVEVDLVGGLLWHLLPPRGWRLPRTSGVELSLLRISRAGIEVAYAPVGVRSDAEIGVGALAIQLATAHDLMRSADELMRDGQLDEAMRGYRALLASGGPDQPIVLGRILALAATRSSWFHDGVELARQALARWPHFSPAHAALAAIVLAQGDARAAASHLHAVARLASGEGDDDEAAVASLSGARLLRILEPRASTPLYQLALEHDPGSLESADALAERLSEEARWPELVRLLRARAVTAAPERAAQIRLRLAEVLAYELGDAAAAHAEVSSALEVAPLDPSVHEMAAMLREVADDPTGARLAWLEVIDRAQHRSAAGDRRIEARAWARLGMLSEPDGAEAAWQRALGLHPAEPEAVRGLARSHRERGEYNEAIALYERMRGAGLPLHLSAPFELDLARCLIDIDRIEDARAALRRAAVGRSETAAEAHAVLADVAAASDPHHAAAEFDTAIASLVDLAEGAAASEGHRLFRRAAQLAVARADLLARQGDEAAATGDLQRAHFLSANHDAQVARLAARALLERSGGDPAAERRWLDAVLATEPDAASARSHAASNHPRMSAARWRRSAKRHGYRLTPSCGGVHSNSKLSCSPISVTSAPAPPRYLLWPSSPPLATSE